MMEKIILASTSPRRKELLSKADVQFDICIKNTDEEIPDGFTPEEVVEFLAKKKAVAVMDCTDDYIILGADTIVALDDKILGKPSNKEEAFEMLKFLSGKTHKVITGVCLAKNKRIITFHEVSEVTFYELSDEEITHYVATGEPMDKAGAYGIQGKGCVLVKRINGDYCNIVGLPVARVIREIKKFNEK